ncbi:MAG: CinA family nicotinamide mononucleotide deamidase-related protein [Bacteroidota bacterium]
MKAQIITIGDELLIGQTIDTNSAWMGAELSKIGFDVSRKISVHDSYDDIKNILGEVTGRADVVLITGGLGPTSDDITKKVLCEFFNSRMVINAEVLSMVKEMMKKRGIAMIERNRLQAGVPEASRVLTNAMGTAPGMRFEKEGTIFVSMPGIPYEMQYIMNEHVIPDLKKRFSSRCIIHRNIMTYGAPEARLAEMLTGFEQSLPECIKLAYLPSYGVIKLRLTATGADRKRLEKTVDEQVNKLYEIIPDLIFSATEESLESYIGRSLRKRNQSMCTAESCTGGKIASLITGIPGSSEYFKGSVIAYDNSIKEELLKVPGDVIRKYGAVSEQAAKRMAEGARDLLKTSYAVATTGIAGPDGGTREKPVGIVWIAVSSARGTVAENHFFYLDRIANINRFSYAALNLLRRQIEAK